MTSVTITIKNKKAIAALEEMRSKRLIDFSGRKSRKGSLNNKKEKTLTHLASEKVLSRDWLTKKEDKVWQDL
jgi:hypothetical protein